MSKFPIKRSILFLFFVGLQIVLLFAYLQNRDFINHITPNLITQSYWPALQYKWSNQKAPSPSGTASSVPVLIYHGIIDKADGSNVLINDFRDQMFTLKRQGWNAVPLDDFEAYMDGKKQLPAKSFLLTFDDGRKDSYYPVQPILDALDWHATMFVITEHVTHNNRSTYYLNRDELLKMKQSGRWALQAHTQNGHDLMDVTADGKKGDFYSNLLWLKDKNRLETEPEFETRVHNDLTGVISDMQTELGITPTTFAFPFGDYGQETLNNPAAQVYVTSQVKQLFKYAFVQEQVSSASFGHNAPGQSLLNLQRVEVYPGWTGANLAKVMSIGDYKTLPYQTNFTDVEGWNAQYGSLSIDGMHGMRVAPAKGATSVGITLDGTRLWNNVDYTITADWRAGESVSLVARYRGSKDYLLCTFDTLGSRVQQVVGGTVTTLATGKPAEATSGTQLRMVVHDADVACDQNGTELVKAAGVSSRQNGAIGIQTWDKTADASLIYVTNASIK